MLTFQQATTQPYILLMLVGIVFIYFLMGVFLYCVEINKDIQALKKEIES